MARTSASLISGRRSSRRNSRSLATILPPHLRTYRWLAPISLISPTIDSSSPRTSEVIPTMAVTPMTIPRIVRNERSLWATSVSMAMRALSRICVSPWLSRSRVRSEVPESSLMSEGHDRIEPRGLGRGVDPEHDADQRRHPDPQRDRPPLERVGERRDLGDQDRDPEPERHSGQPAEGGEDDGLGQELAHDVRSARPDRLADADLARALGDGDEHDVHHHDPPDDERDRHQAHQGGVDAGRDLPVEVEELLGRHEAEVVGLRRP